MAEAFVLNVGGFELSSDYMASHADDIYQIRIIENASERVSKSYRLFVILGSLFGFTTGNNSQSLAAVNIATLCKPGSSLSFCLPGYTSVSLVSVPSGAGNILTDSYSGTTANIGGTLTVIGIL